MKRTPFAPILVLTAFLANSFGSFPIASAQELKLPVPGVMVHLSPPFNPPILKGIKVYSNNPFKFDFILDQGDSLPVIPAKAGIQNQEQMKQQATKLIKYFLASLTIPEKDLWVNLSPYEKNRIIPQSFGLTEMGRDLLAEDYMLKQITASLIYPEGEVGKKFWKRIYEEAAKKFGTTNIPVNTFNKVWIIPQKAVVYENAKAGTAYVVEARLKVMLEEDYLALFQHVIPAQATASPPKAVAGIQDTSALGSQIVREIVIPELTKEVNEDKNFAQLRQVYNSLILATWYKKKIKESILAQVYENKNKVSGILSSPNAFVGDPEHIYQRYLQAFKKGAYNYIKEEIDPITQQSMPRKYFSGGFGFTKMYEAMYTASTVSPAMLGEKDLVRVDSNFLAEGPQENVMHQVDFAMQIDPKNFRYEERAWSGTGALKLSQNYKDRFLPLVNPSHPGIPKDWKPQPNISLVAFIPAEDLIHSPGYQKIREAIEQSPLLKNKVSFTKLESIHFSFRGGYSADDLEKIRTQLKSAAGFRVRIKGIFINDYIQGRAFFKVYPEFDEKTGQNGAQKILNALGSPFFGTHPAGFLQLTDDLNEEETKELLRIIEEFKDEDIAEFQVNHLVLGSHQNDLLGGWSEIGKVDLADRAMNRTDKARTVEIKKILESFIEGQEAVISAVISGPNYVKNVKGVYLHSNIDGEWKTNKTPLRMRVENGKSFFDFKFRAKRSFHYTFKIEHVDGTTSWADQTQGDGQVWVNRNFKGSVVYVGSEFARFVKKGGQGDVMYELPRNLVKAGVDVTVILPFYKGLAEKYKGVEDVEGIEITVHFKRRPPEILKVKKAVVDGITVYMLDAKSMDLFDTPDSGQKAEFYESILLSKGTAELLYQLNRKFNKKAPDMVVFNDHHTALIPLYMRSHSDFFAKTGRVFKIHNIGYQGEYDGTIAIKKILEIDSIREDPKSIFHPDNEKGIWKKVSDKRAELKDGINLIEDVIPHIPKGNDYDKYLSILELPDITWIDELGLGESEQIKGLVIKSGKLNFMAVAPGVAQLEGFKGWYAGTVSPTYAEEIRHTEFQLDKLLQQMGNHFGGILNGIDYEVNNPETDEVLKMLKEEYPDFNLDNYSLENDGIEGVKAARLKFKRLIQFLFSKDKVPDWESNKKIKKTGFLQEDPSRLLVGVIGRMSQQKQIDIVVNMIEEMADGTRPKLGVDFLIAGPVDDDLENKIKELEGIAQRSGIGFNVVVLNGWVTEMANLMYAGCDIILMPSDFEPSGITQQLAKRYGALPLVRKTGGLADTVFESGEDDNGFVFNGTNRRMGSDEDIQAEKQNTDELYEKMKEAAEVYKNNQDLWDIKMTNAMRDDSSWELRQRDWLNVFAWLHDELTQAGRDAAMKSLEEILSLSPAQQRALRKNDLLAGSDVSKVTGEELIKKLQSPFFSLLDINDMVSKLRAQKIFLRNPEPEVTKQSPVEVLTITPKTIDMLHEHGIRTIKELMNYTVYELARWEISRTSIVSDVYTKYNNLMRSMMKYGFALKAQDASLEGPRNSPIEILKPPLLLFLYCIKGNIDIVEDFRRILTVHDFREKVWLQAAGIQYIGSSFKSTRVKASEFKFISDSAMLTTTRGGIDLTSDKALSVQNNGQGIKFHIDPEQLTQLENASGFAPVIVDMQPLKSLSQFLEV